MSGGCEIVYPNDGDRPYFYRHHNDFYYVPEKEEEEYVRPKTEEKICPSCTGFGLNYRGDDCRECCGRGVIWVEVEE